MRSRSSSSLYVFFGCCFSENGNAEDKLDQSNTDLCIKNANNEKAVDNSDLLPSQANPKYSVGGCRSKQKAHLKPPLPREVNHLAPMPVSNGLHPSQLSLSLQAKPPVARLQCREVTRSLMKQPKLSGRRKRTGFFLQGTEEFKSPNKRHNKDARLKKTSLPSPPRLARLISSRSQSSEHYDDRSPVFGGGLSESSFANLPRRGLSGLGSNNSDTQYGGDEGAKPRDWVNEKSPTMSRDMIHSEGRINEEDKRPLWAGEDDELNQVVVLLTPKSVRNYMSSLPLEELSEEVEDLEDQEPDIALPEDSVIFLNDSEANDSFELLTVDVEGR